MMQKCDIDELNLEITKFWASPAATALCETYELYLPGGPRNVSPEERFMRGSSKLLDYYAFSPLVRRMMGHPTLLLFLREIFEEEPKLFQSLTFWKASEAPPHRDSAYVQIPEGPSAMVGVWWALEDVIEGAGQIEVFPGSHRDPHYMFGGKNKWLDSAPAEIADFVQWNKDSISQYNRSKVPFFGREGDCIVWHADMIHQSAPVEINGASRQSHVAHFTADTLRPRYDAERTSPTLYEHGIHFINEFAGGAFHHS